MASHSALSPEEAADRLALRELFDAYAHCADIAAAEWTKGAVHGGHSVCRAHGRSGTEPTSVLEGREALTPVFDDLNRYQATMHFNGKSTVVVDGSRQLETATPSPITSIPKMEPA